MRWRAQVRVYPDFRANSRSVGEGDLLYGGVVGDALGVAVAVEM